MRIQYWTVEVWQDNEWKVTSENFTFIDWTDTNIVAGILEKNTGNPHRVNLLKEETLPDPKADLVMVDSGGGWEGLFINGKLVTQGHSVSVEEVVHALSEIFPAITYTAKEAHPEYMDEVGSFGDDLSTEYFYGEPYLNLESRNRIEAVINANHCGSNSGWYVFVSNRKDETKFYLGIRTHDLGGTDYDYIDRLTKDEAKAVLKLKTKIAGHWIHDMTHNALNKD